MAGVEMTGNSVLSAPARRSYSPEQKIARAARTSRWYHANRERVLAKMATPDARSHKNDLRRVRYAADPEARAKAAVAFTRWRLENPDQIKEAQRKYQLSEKGRARKREALLRRFSLTPELYDALLAAQGGVCAICRQPETHRHRGTGAVVSLAIDHDHRCCPGKGSCGQCIRGLLCDRCNVGRFPDEPALLRAAADYFERTTK